MKTFMPVWANADKIFLDEIGGQEGIKDFVRCVEQLNALPCPFCGGEAAVNVEKAYIPLVVTVFCTNCGIKTKERPTGQVITGESYSLHDRLAQALNDWNQRTHDKFQLEKAARTTTNAPPKT